MSNKHRTIALIKILFQLTITLHCHAQSTASGGLPFAFSVLDRTRVNSWQWFAAPPESETYSYVENLLRVFIAQRLHRWDWRLELAQASVFGLPNDATSALPAQGQLGFGATYYAANNNNSNVAAAYLKQSFLRYHFTDANKNLRIGRFEYIEGEETEPKNPTIIWLQSNRIAHRLIGDFVFSDAQRSFDGIDGHYGNNRWDISAMAGRADQGVFNMNGNPELNVDIQYLAFTKSDWNQHVLWRIFALDYHDGRTGVTKVDNRNPVKLAADHQNIRIGTYGGDFLTSIPLGNGHLDFLFWGALQNGRWGSLGHGANAVAIEGGYQVGEQSAPWIRAGWFRGSGDNNAQDNRHDTFFQVLPTPRIYARFPFYNLMNSTDEFIQVVDNPIAKLALRSDLHSLQLTSGNDLWYLGGGTYDNKVFGYTGRPASGKTSFASVADISADWQTTKNVAVNFYYAHAWGKSAIQRVYPTDHNAQYGYVEMVYRFDIGQRGVKY